MLFELQVNLEHLLLVSGRLFFPYILAKGKGGEREREREREREIGIISVPKSHYSNSCFTE
jgi:hypothetical protein